MLSQHRRGYCQIPFHLLALRRKSQNRALVHLLLCKVTLESPFENLCLFLDAFMHVCERAHLPDLPQVVKRENALYFTTSAPALPCSLDPSHSISFATLNPALGKEVRGDKFCH